MIRLTVLLVIFSSIAYGQNKKTTLPPDLIQFFQGQWYGKGAFSNGKPIEADVSFELTLDSSWLLYHHLDKLPNHYKATTLWGVDTHTGQFVAYTFDNFHGHRQFTTDGWSQGRLQSTTREYYAEAGWLFQQFTYEKTSDTSFKMTYEVSKDAHTWKVGDYLVFTKK